MTRLLPLALVALAPLAGCADDPDPAETPSPVTGTAEVAPDLAAPATATVLDTTGAAPDTTGFFDEAEAAAEEAGAHTHADGETHEH
ncbi:hypothetical protein [Rubrivirga marina]|jgi:hypothetical protein|uniref:Uncharacterized protein n=1 Tax=Rubrivirga marina TaxID=1196024 RepID=A0A271ITL6_9BACT|nr:hypothetical protein [Rubrivirga marina]PAP74571.1 hypothetical protein BSZ37_20545 [Rubrivirga marina]